MASAVEPEATTVAQAVFYNMTGQDVEMQLSPTPPEVVSAIPGTSPYTPNHNASTYKRVAAEHRANEFGASNQLNYHATSEAFTVSVTINVNTTHYEVTEPILVFMFHTTVVAMCPTDSVAYVSDASGVVDMDPGSGRKLE